MTWQATAWAAAQRTGSPTDKLVLLIVANHYTDAAAAFVRQTVIGAEAELSRRAVQMALGRLEAAGLILREKQYFERGGRRCDVIRLPVFEAEAEVVAAHREAREAESKGASGAPLEAHQVRLEGRTTRAQGAHDVRGVGAPDAPISNERQTTLTESSKGRPAPPAAPEGAAPPGHGETGKAGALHPVLAAGIEGEATEAHRRMARATLGHCRIEDAGAAGLVVRARTRYEAGLVEAGYGQAMRKAAGVPLAFAGPERTGTGHAVPPPGGKRGEG